jgi:hypothetical protein
MLPQVRLPDDTAAPEDADIALPASVLNARTTLEINAANAIFRLFR